MVRGEANCSKLACLMFSTGTLQPVPGFFQPSCSNATEGNLGLTPVLPFVLINFTFHFCVDMLFKVARGIRLLRMNKYIYIYTSKSTLHKIPM